MRFAGLALLLVITACSEPSAQNHSPSSPTASPTPPVRSCQVPVAWDHGSESHRAFVTYPGGHIDEVGQTNGDVYDAQYQRWVQGPQELVSPDGSRYTYFSFSSSTPANGQVHVVDVVSGVDRIIYDGATSYWPSRVSLNVFAADARGVWMGSWGGLWHYSDAEGARRVSVGSDQDMVTPAGPCI